MRALLFKDQDGKIVSVMHDSVSKLIEFRIDGQDRNVIMPNEVKFPEEFKSVIIAFNHLITIDGVEVPYDMVSVNNCIKIIEDSFCPWWEHLQTFKTHKDRRLIQQELAYLVTYFGVGGEEEERLALGAHQEYSLSETIFDIETIDDYEFKLPDGEVYVIYSDDVAYEMCEDIVGEDYDDLIARTPDEIASYVDEDYWIEDRIGCNGYTYYLSPDYDEALYLGDYGFGDLTAYRKE
jgi:hypothetical protein